MNPKKIIITGGGGFLGTHLTNLIQNVFPNTQVYIPRSSEVDLRNIDQAHAYFQSIEAELVIAVAARLGGIGDNRKYPASYFHDNIMIGMNTIEAARHSNAKKIINIGTVCSYPKTLPAPFKEEDLWNGYPEPTNGAYGIAKKAVAEYAIAVKKQYGLSCVNLLMTNLYGVGDDFREETSHVIPALIKKIHTAKQNQEKTVVAWGDGSPTRDFIYVTDAANAIVQSINCNYEQPINIGSGKDISIKELYSLICKHMHYEGDVFWDTSKPNGQPKRLLDISKAKNMFGFKPSIDFENGLKLTLDWYINNRSKIDSLAPKHKN
jgi:GDP-L-fucose synthase